MRAWLPRTFEGSSCLFDALSTALGTDAAGHADDAHGSDGFDHEMAQRLPLDILLTEDNPVNQKVAMRMLERLGYEPSVAANGQEVLEALGQADDDVVLMDVQMPVMDGYVAKPVDVEALVEALSKASDQAGQP